MTAFCVFVFGRLRELDDHGQQAAVAVPEGTRTKLPSFSFFPLPGSVKVDIPAVQRIGRFQQVHADKSCSSRQSVMILHSAGAEHIDGRRDRLPLTISASTASPFGSLFPPPARPPPSFGR